jgi:hypothetical protein
LLTLYLYYYIDLGWIGYGIILAIIGFSIYAYMTERERIEKGNERFRGNNLFFRYGVELYNAPFHIPVKDEWTATESESFGTALVERIQKYFLENYGNHPLNGKQIINIIGVTDGDRPSDSRGFLKISFTGSRGSIFTRFLTYQLVGKYIVLHKFVFLLGIVHWFDLIFFLLTSPITILFWIYSWIKGEYSIYAKIAREIGNSFEILDVRTYYESSTELIENAAIAELKAQGLYTKEIGQQINNFFGPINQYGDNNSIISNIK